MQILLVIGTLKGAFLARSDARREKWTVEGPLFKGWQVGSAVRNADGKYLFAITSNIYGAAIQASTDLKEWKQVEAGPQYPQGGKRKLNQIWKLFAGRRALYAGVDEAGLFRSDDGGGT